MKGYKALLFLLITTCLFAFDVTAQKSSKTKAAKKLYEKGGSVVIKNAKAINTSNLEFSPSFYQNGLVYATSRKSQGERDKKINETYFELYFASLDGNGLPLNPKQFSLEMNSQLHEGPVTFSRDGNVIYFTRNNLKKGVRKADDQGVTRLKIYEAEKGPEDWENVKELPFNSDNYSVCHPTLSADGKKLYFSSDMPGGTGGMDLWVVERQGETWSSPINLGPEINTIKNEVFPFIHSTGNLFFASNGHEGLGGLDIFRIDIGSKVWGAVSNIGEPFNSPSDDLGLILTPGGTKGYFASDRAGGNGKDDIYLFEAFDGVGGETAPEVITSTIQVYDASNNNRIEDAEIRIFERTSEGFIGGGNDLYEAVLMPADAGSGELVFKLIRKDAGSLGDADRTTDSNGEAIYDFIGEKRYLLFISKDGYASNEVVYSTLGNVGAGVVEVPLNRSVCAELSGVVKDKGRNAPIPNAIVKITSTCNGTEDVLLADANGHFNYCLPAGCDYVVTGIKENYTNGMTTFASVTAGAPLSTEIMLSPISSNVSDGVYTGGSFGEGSTIILENIYYDFNKSFIRSGAAVELDELRDLMSRYPSMVIELSSHTDSRGGTAYNQQLSEKRAESAKEYLVARGIASNRITTRGFGESQLRNNCIDGSNCSEEEHQYNRRTEVKVLSVTEKVNVQYHDRGPEVINGRY